ncbi:hypothetical protein [Candidatus Pyrohabitans sp.]
MNAKKIAAALVVSYALLVGYVFGMGMMGGMMGGMSQGYGWYGAQEGGLPDRFLGGYLRGGPAGMMGGGMMGYAGMMGGCGGFWGGYSADGEITPEKAEEALNRYLEYTGNPNLGLRELMEFRYNYYAIVEEKDTGKGAFELLVDRRTGLVTPEPGPNMMWNIKYGHHATGYITENRLTAEEAVEMAQRYIDVYFPGWKADDEPVEFYGYYTLHILDRKGRITGMLSVNGFTGDVWFHSWHGEYSDKEHAEQVMR